MKQYRLVNNILGWVIGLVACLVYILTAEATASWWDCGEFIATAQKLEVGHPPGAPTFQLIGRLFSMFSSPEQAAHAINIMSALCSGVGIMFLFWTITLLGKKLLKGEPSLKDARTWAVFAAAVVGSLAYTFSDTYWFSAVEGEVYAMSSFFTAVVFWAILKWEEQADDPHSLRWLILICFLVGLAIGVHLLNLLTIPAIVYVVYFKKWPKTTWKGFILSGLLSVVLLAVVLWGIIPGIVNVDSAIDVFFVNKLHLPFNSGTIFFFVLLAAAIAWGLWYTRKKNQPIINASILGLLMLIIGYTTFFMLVIRANTNTPLNENCPRDGVALRAYLGREQYGQTPLLYGQYYTAGNPIEVKQGYAKYVRGTDSQGRDRYIAKSYASNYVYREKHCGPFPRMWSNDGSRQHPQFYRYWTGEPPRGEKPTMSQNLKFFNRYQCGFMYWRYFMWNFAGRQNDIQGHYFNNDGTRDYLHGNWISGIKFIDQMRLGPQDNLPDHMKNNKARNTYFMLPLLLGLLGLLYHCLRNKKDAFIVFIMFFMTGLAIEIYLNMPPRQPRERDYAFVGSFYFFAIWIGLGIMGLADWITKLTKKEELYKVVLPVVFVVCLLAVPVRMASQNWDDHDRSQKTAARDFAKNYLNGVRPNSILVTFGDNDTFPLWYAQEVEGVRTDVRILNYTLAGMHWYIEQLYNKLYDSDPLPLTLPYDFYGLGEDQVFIIDRTDEYLEVSSVLAMLRDRPDEFTVRAQNGDPIHYLPTRNFKVTIDVDKLVSLGVIPEELRDRVNPEVRFSLNLDKGREMLLRHELMMLDLIGTNRFERDITLMSAGYISKVFSIHNTHSIGEGMLFKLLPYPAQQNFTDETCDFFLHGVRNADGTRTPLEWGNLNSDIYIDPVSENMSLVQRQTMGLVAEEQLRKGDTESAQELLKQVDYFFPSYNFPREKYSMQFIPIYIAAKQEDKARELWQDVLEYYRQDLNYVAQYYNSKNRQYVAGVRAQITEDAQILYTLSIYAERDLHDTVLKQQALAALGEYSRLLYQQQ
ncbi:MAG: DUF2723 domain-containing protein [Bacteroidales bacterium]|nr:DUF2723 domain-containing protein [Bacteroidales bacterium]